MDKTEVSLQAVLVRAQSFLFPEARVKAHPHAAFPRLLSTGCGVKVAWRYALLNESAAFLWLSEESKQAKNCGGA